MAATDDLQMICSPLRTVETRELVTEIQRLQSASPFDAIVVGRPHLMVGRSDDSTPHIDRAVNTLKKAFPGMPIHFVDEGFTSQEASVIQRQGGMKSSKRREKGSLDAIAASLILQRHLDARAYR